VDDKLTISTFQLFQMLVIFCDWMLDAIPLEGA
jgi:hypothetical protein